MSNSEPTNSIPNHRQRLRNPNAKPAPIKPVPVKLDIAELRVHLRSLSDNELRSFGREARTAINSMTELKPSDPAREELAMRIQEVTLEYQRRFKRNATTKT
jgi:hypothetical protein